MRAPNRDELEAMVAAAERRALLGPKDPGVVKPPRSHHLANIANSFSSLPQFLDVASKTESARTERGEALGRYLDESRTVASSRAAAATDLLAAESKAWDVLIDDRAPEPDGIAPWDPERTPVLFVRTATGGSLHDFGIEDGNNWAKWSARATGDAIASRFTTKVSFFHIWAGPRRRASRADITVGLSASGHLSTNADGMGFPAGLFWDDSSCEVKVSARLTIWPLWVPDAQQPFQSVSIGRSYSSGDILGDADAAAVVNGTQLQAVQVAVPRASSLLIEASIVAELDAYMGTAEADFASEPSFNVRCPYCIVIS